MCVVVFPLVCLFCLHYNIIMLVLSSSRVDHSCAVSVKTRAFYVIFFIFLGQKGLLNWVAREFFRTKKYFYAFQSHINYLLIILPTFAFSFQQQTLQTMHGSFTGRTTQSMFVL